MTSAIRPAPEWRVDQWFNTAVPLSVQSFKGKVVALESFQMLCPGCVSHGLPQAQRISATFGRDEVAVLGLHTVFEHHAAMSPVSLQAFLHEYRISFPVGVDRSGSSGGIPETMSAYGMRGTPTLSLIDAKGVLRYQHFGQVGDMLVGAQIAELVAESRLEAIGMPAARTAAQASMPSAGSDDPIRGGDAAMRPGCSCGDPP